MFAPAHYAAYKQLFATEQENVWTLAESLFLNSTYVGRCVRSLLITENLTIFITILLFQAWPCTNFTHQQFCLPATNGGIKRLTTRSWEWNSKKQRSISKKQCIFWILNIHLQPREWQQRSARNICSRFVNQLNLFRSLKKVCRQKLF